MIIFKGKQPAGPGKRISGRRQTKIFTKESMDMNEEINMQELLNTDIPIAVLEKAKPFENLMAQYRCAIMEVETKIRVLNEEFKTNYKRNPIETIKSRVKTPIAIVEKLKRKNFPLSLASIEENLHDVAGIRVICSFPEDIYKVAELIERQDDIRIVETKDYIRNPKPNGYRSLHLILEIPIFLAEGKKLMRVEVQFRTIAMDFWASLEHKLAYKHDIENQEAISRELKNCAEIISSVDYRMQEIRNMIDRNTQ